MSIVKNPKGRYALCAHPVPVTQTCKGCKEELPYTSFYVRERAKGDKFYLRKTCKMCFNRKGSINKKRTEMRKITQGKRITTLYAKLKARRVYKRKREKILARRKVYDKLGITKNTKALKEGDFAEHVRLEDGKEN